jgi:hypothetical protein
MLRIIVSALLLILGGLSFTGSPAQAQGPITTFGPGTSTEALPWCSGLSLTPYCPVGKTSRREAEELVATDAARFATLST